MVPFLRRLCALTTFLPCAQEVWTFVDFALSAECPGFLWSWLFLGFVRWCYELAPDVLVTFLVALAAVILFGTGDFFPSWLFLGFVRRCYELEPDVLFTFLVALAAVILFGTGDWFPSGQACLGNCYLVDFAQCAFVLLPSVIVSVGPGVLLRRVLGRAVEWLSLCGGACSMCFQLCLSLISEDAFNLVIWFLPVHISFGFCSGSLYSGALYTLHVCAQLFFTVVAISVVCDRTCRTLRQQSLFSTLLRRVTHATQDAVRASCHACHNETFDAGCYGISSQILQNFFVLVPTGYC